ncbi:MAG: WYL domain-containing protein [Bacteroidetes bacterium]|jgi:hypothetical protein|nr:WYL domain-containing protein [Bacteroidota bacterium]
MANKKALSRYCQLIHLLEHTSGMSKKDLLEKMSDYYADGSGRTFDRDIQALREEFQVPVVYKPDTGYRLEDRSDAPSARRYSLAFRYLLYKQNELDLIAEACEPARDGSSYLHFDHIEGQAALTHMRALLPAIRQSRMIRLHYQRFGQAHAAEHSLQPHVLRRVGGRWYLLAWHPAAGNWGYFGLERIQAVEVLEAQFGRQPRHKLEEKLLESMGAYGGTPELVKLRFSPGAAPYVDTLPLHSTQEKETPQEADAHTKGVVYTYWMAITPDMVARILSFGAAVEVVSPNSLRNEVATQLRAAQALYQTAETR